jgi:hypothetical protein
VYRCLTIRQPWAHLVVTGQKDEEYRPRATRHRGLLLVHSGKAAVPRDVRADFPGIDFDALTYGAVVGAVDVTDCVEDGDCFAYVLSRPARFSRPVVVAGQLGIWHLPPALESAIRVQLTGRRPAA